MTKHNALIVFRSGDTYHTSIDIAAEPPATIARRMTAEGFLICTDTRWGRERTLIINLADVSCIVLEPTA